MQEGAVYHEHVHWRDIPAVESDLWVHPVQAQSSLRLPLTACRLLAALEVALGVYQLF